MKITTIFTLLALAASALAVYAQDPGGPTPADQPPPGQAGPGGRGGPGLNSRRPAPSLLMQALDLNHDGVLDADEIAKAPASLKTLDKNGDGRLTPDELRPPRAARSSIPADADLRRAQGPEATTNGPGAPASTGRRLPLRDPLMRALDLNHDGVLDADEIANAATSLLTLDKNGDGQLTPDELRPTWPAKLDGSASSAEPGLPPDLLMWALDRDGDGILDESEMADAADSLQVLDKNGDGKLTPDELRPPWLARRAGSAASGDPGLLPSPLMRALDANHDGVIDANEIANAPAALKTLDKNRDGQLSQDELRPEPRPNTGRPSMKDTKLPGLPPGSQ